jgi:hypothetical protein
MPRALRPVGGDGYATTSIQTKPGGKLSAWPLESLKRRGL